MRTLLDKLKDTGSERLERESYIALFAARMFAAGEDNDHYNAHAEPNVSAAVWRKVQVR